MDTLVSDDKKNNDNYLFFLARKNDLNYLNNMIKVYINKINRSTDSNIIYLSGVCSQGKKYRGEQSQIDELVLQKMIELTANNDKYMVLLWSHYQHEHEEIASKLKKINVNATLVAGASEVDSYKLLSKGFNEVVEHLDYMTIDKIVKKYLN
ncbi:MAG: hypothetical protein WC758_06815 [Candidatus Woesearchaeota archaeon]|jgi:hypothetical protein